MEDRKRWETCQREYEHKLKSAWEKMREQDTMFKQDLEKQSANCLESNEKLKTAHSKISDIELKLQKKSDRINYLEQHCQELEKYGEINLKQHKENTVTLAELRSELEECRQALENAQKDSLELKRLKPKFLSSLNKTQHLEDKVIKLESKGLELQSKINYEVENGERREITISRLNDENLLFRREQQRLHLVEVELETVREKMQQHDDNDQKLQKMKLENIGLRKSNSILTDQLEMLERCNNQLKFELERMENKSTTSPVTIQTVHQNYDNTWNPNIIELTPRHEQQTSQRKSYTLHSTSGSVRSECPVSPMLQPIGSQTVSHCTSAEKPPIKFVTVPTNTRPQPFLTSSVSYSHISPVSETSTQLCETDILLLKSLREMMTRNKESSSKMMTRKKETSLKYKKVQTKSNRTQKHKKSYLSHSQPPKVNGRRSNSNAVKPRKKGNRSNKLKKSRTTLSNASTSRMKVSKKSGLGNHRSTEKCY